MFAVVARVELPEGRTIEQGRQQLESEVIPRLKGSPGFASALFLAPKTGNEGLSVIVFHTEQEAIGAQERFQPAEGVKMLHSEVREVAASA
jgi:hypothetical protein